MFPPFLKFSSWSIGSKLTLILITIISLILLSFTSLINYNLKQQTEKQATTDVSDKTQLIVSMLETFDSSLRSRVNDFSGIFKNAFKAGITLDNAHMIDIAGTSTPALKSEAGDLNGDFTIPDQLQKQFNIITTIFVKKNDEFIRISTSLKNENGVRALGTTLDHGSPAYQELINGKSFVGVSELFHKQYMTEYDPITDSSGKVIGILFVGLDFTESIGQLKEKIRAMKIGETGYYFAIDAREGKTRGDLMIHPSKEGQNLLEAKDKDGHEFIKEIVQKKQGVIHYPWLNAELGETSVRTKVVAFYPLKNWSWVIAGGVYEDEFSPRNQCTDLTLSNYQRIADFHSGWPVICHHEQTFEPSAANRDTGRKKSRCRRSEHYHSHRSQR